MAITRIGTYAQIQGSSFKLPCKVATTGAITLSGTQTIDGVAVVAGDRVLVKDQGTGSTNGIYIVAAGAWSRAVDMSINEDLFEGLLIHVNSGTTNADKIFYLNTADPITLGVTSLTFTLSTAGGGSVAIGGTVTSGTAGSVLFIDPTATLAQDNSNLFWDNTNNRLGIGTTTPVVGLEVKDRSGIRITDTTNVTTQLALVNQTAASTTNVQISYTTNSGQAFIGKRQPSAAASGPLVASDLFIQNNDTANIVLYNSFASGTIKFAAGASATAHVTIGTTGLTTFATGVDYKRLNPTTTTTASTATLTPDISAGDVFTITAQAAALSVANPTGTPVNGQKMIIRIKDNGTARAITWSGTQYRASTDLALPTTTIINKTMYLGFIWNSTDSKWDLLAFLNNF